MQKKATMTCKTRHLRWVLPECQFLKAKTNTMKVKTLNPGECGLIRQTEDGRILQVGMTSEQSAQLQIFLGVLSQDQPLIEMGEDWELESKNKTQ